MDRYIMTYNLHHSFDVDLATELGDPVLAILVHHFQFWIKANAMEGRNFHDGRTWMFQSYKNLSIQFPYLSIQQIERLIIKLVKMKIIIKGNYNKTKYDRTLWYAFVDEAKFTIFRQEKAKEQNSTNVSEPQNNISSKNVNILPKSRDATPQIEGPIPDHNKDHNKERKVYQRNPELAGSLPRADFQKRYKREENVETTEEEHKKLVQAHGEEKTKRFYKILSDWKLDTPKSKWKKNDYRSILRWVVDAAKEKETKTKKVENPEINYRFSEDFIKKYSDQFLKKGFGFTLRPTFIKITHISTQVFRVINLSDPGYQEQLEAEAKLLGIM